MEKLRRVIWVVCLYIGFLVLWCASTFSENGIFSPWYSFFQLGWFGKITTILMFLAGPVVIGWCVWKANQATEKAHGKAKLLQRKQEPKGKK